MTWEALEDALLPPSSLRGTPTGVFVGICSSDYNSLALRLPLDRMSGYAGTGMGRSPSAGRISYVLGLRGPAFAVDTACSSSLVALHLAMQSLRRQECDRAIVAGVNLILEPSGHVAFSQAGMLSSDGRCKTFSDGADGYSRAEGVGVIVLERKDVLARSGRSPIAWVRGTALNQDGTAGGLTVPSGPAQQEVIRTALANGGVAPEAVSFVEAHGTGTPLGDVIELNALASVFRETHSKERPVTVGSIKANVGHMEAAAGVGSLVKLIEQLVRREIPRSPNFGPLNRRIQWGEIPLHVAQGSAVWGKPGEKLYGGVNSFGFSGTNGHAVLCSVSNEERPVRRDDRWVPRILPLSARSDSALARMRKDYATFVSATEHVLEDICASTQRGREPMPYRVVAHASDPLRLSTALASGEDLIRRRSEPAGTPKVAWLFSGQGSQRPGMGQALYAKLRVFRGAIDRCAAWLRAHADMDLLDVLFGTTERDAIHKTVNAQPALFAYEWSLAQQWLAWGLTPDFVAGHSVGELVAACVADVFSVEDGLKLIAARGSLMQALPSGGKMLAVQATTKAIADLLEANPLQLSIAAVNSPDQVVLSGAGGAIDLVAATLQARGVRYTPLSVSHAFHSPLMAPMLDSFQKVAQEVTFHPPRFTLISNVTGAAVNRDVASPGYWRTHVMAPVQFGATMQTLESAGCRVFLEVGPTPVLTALGRKNINRSDVAWVASARGSDEIQAVESCLASLWVEGFDIDWSSVQDGGPVPAVDLPKYPFERIVYWLPESNTTATTTSRASGRPLLGGRLDTPALGGVAVYEGVLDPAVLPYLSDHRVFDQAIFPATGYAELLLEAGRAVGLLSPSVVGLEIERPLRIADDEASRFQVVVGGPEGPLHCQVLTPAADGGWVVLCRAELRETRSSADHPPRIPGLEGASVDVARLRALNADKGLEHRDRFWALRSAHRNAERAVGTLELHEELVEQARAHQIHPVLLDGCFQVAMCLTEDVTDLLLPVGIELLRVFQPGATKGVCAVSLRESVGSGIYRIDLALYAEDGGLIASADGITARRITREAMRRALGSSLPSFLYRRDYVQTPSASAAVASSARWLVIGRATPFRHELAAQLGASAAVAVADPEVTATAVSALDRSNELARTVYLADAPVVGEVPGETVARHLFLLAELVKGLTMTDANADVRLTVITDETDDMARGAIRAWMDSASREHSQLTCRVVAVGDANDAVRSTVKTAALVVAELKDSRESSEVLLSGGARHEPVWRSFSPKGSDDSRPLPATASYLITGGTGDLGLACAERMIHRGARHLILTYRSSPGAHVQATVERLERLGAKLTLVQTDLSKEVDVVRLFDVIATLPARLDGIVHAAGRVHDGLLRTLTADTFREVFDAKATGALFLHQHSLALGLRLFVVFSSLAAAFGSPAQTHYAAANGFCDGLIAHRRRNGLPGQSIQWGPWSDIGMASRLDVEQKTRMQRAGLRYLSPQAALDLFDALLLGDHPHTVLAADIAWDTAAGQWLLPGQRRSAAELVSRSSLDPDESPAVRALASATEEDRPAALRRFLEAEVLRALGEDPGRALDANATLSELGLDSLGAVELTNRLVRVFGVKLPRRLELDQASVEHLARMLLEQPIDWLSLRGDAARPASVEEPPTSSDTVTHMGGAPTGQEHAWKGFHISLGGLRWGDAAAARIVLLHGVRAHAGVWEPVAEKLSTYGHSVIAPDLRGHGLSEHAPPGRFLDLLDMLRDLESVLAGTESDPVVLAAHSFGCSVAVLYAALRPARVRGLLLVEPVIPLLSQPPVERSLLSAAVEIYAGKRAPAHPVMAERDTPVELTRREYPFLSSAMCEQLARRVLVSSADGYRWRWDPALREFDRYGALFADAGSLLGWLRTLRAPVEHVVSNDSQFRTDEVSAALAAALPASRIHKISGSHHLHLEHPQVIADRIHELVGSTDTASPSTQSAA